MFFNCLPCCCDTHLERFSGFPQYGDVKITASVPEFTVWETDVYGNHVPGFVVPAFNRTVSFTERGQKIEIVESGFVYRFQAFTDFLYDYLVARFLFSVDRDARNSFSIDFAITFQEQACHNILTDSADNALNSLKVLMQPSGIRLDRLPYISPSVSVHSAAQEWFLANLTQDEIKTGFGVSANRVQFSQLPGYPGSFGWSALATYSFDGTDAITWPPSSGFLKGPLTVSMHVEVNSIYDSVTGESISLSHFDTGGQPLVAVASPL